MMMLETFLALQRSRAQARADQGQQAYARRQPADRSRAVKETPEPYYIAYPMRDPVKGGYSRLKILYE
jgi:hypothetical protein